MCHLLFHCFCSPVAFVADFSLELSVDQLVTLCLSSPQVSGQQRGPPIVPSSVLHGKRLTVSFTPASVVWKKEVETDIPGDLPRRAALQNAVRQTFSSPIVSSALTPSSSSSQSVSSWTSEEELSIRIQEWREVAVFLRKNVVQGVQDEKGTFREWTSFSHAGVSLGSFLRS